MNLFQLYKYKKGFTPEQARFVKEKQLNASLNIKKWIKILHKISVFDKALDNIKIPKKFYFFLALFIALLWSIIVLIIGDNTSFKFLIFIIPFTTIIISIIINIVYFILKFFMLDSQLSVTGFRLKNSDINNNVREFIFPFLCAIKDDIAINKNIKMNIKADKATDKSYFQKEEKLPLRIADYSRVCKYYLHPLLELKLPLKDGSVAMVNIEDEIRKIVVDKRGLSGKRKKKIKYKVKHKIEIKHMFPKSHYKLAQGVSNVSFNKKYSAVVNVLDSGNIINVNTSIKWKKLWISLIPFDAFMNCFGNSFKQVNPI